MTLSKKGLRTITINNCQYVWSAKSDSDGGFTIAVSSSERKGQLLTAWVDIINTKGAILIVTSYVIRQLILLGFANGWTPNEQKPALNLRRINEQIELSRATYWSPKDK